MARHDHPAPPLPPADHLRHILDTAFFASFAREEGRDLRFVLCCAPGTRVPREGSADFVPVVLFDTPRWLTIKAIRSLAPAVSPANAAILVRWPVTSEAPDTCDMAGVLNVGATLARARSGRAFYHRPAPYALVIDVRDAGELHAYRGGIKLALLKSGSLHGHGGTLLVVALVIGSDLRVLGFGAEIVLDAARPVRAYEGAGPTRPVEDHAEVDSESFGMRHRSALRCVAVAEVTAAFVVSQDGTVSFFWKQAGRVLVKRHVNIANPNMMGV